MSWFYWISQLFWIAVFKLLYRHKVYGIEHAHTGGAIIAPNHASFFDPPVVAASWPFALTFLASSRLFKIPVVAFVIRKLNAYPVSGTGADIASLKLVGQLVQEGRQVVIYPEGARTWDGSLGEIKSGIGMLAIRYQCPLIPTYLHGTYEVWPRTRRFPKPWGRTACVFGSPIFPQQFESLPKKEAQEAVAVEVRKRIDSLRLWYENGAHGSPP